jgi:hypothetical protein
LKFGDIITAVATYAVLQILVAFLLTIAVLPVFGVTMAAHYWAGLTSVFLSMLIVGFLFREEIRKGGRDAILRMVVLSAFYELLVVLFQPTLADWLPFAIGTPTEAFAGTTVTSLEWFLYDLSRRGNMIFNILIVMGLGFIGLHVGSKLNQAPKSQNPKA